MKPMPDHPLNSPVLPRLWALIPCAGSGSRAGSVGPKQYQALAGQPLVLHTLAAFAGVTRLHRVALILAAGDTALNYLSAQYLIANNGGATRAETVFNGLNFLLEQGAVPQDWVLVHDAARCLITPAQIDTLIDACLSDPVGGLLAHRLADTLKAEQDGRVAATVARGDKWLAQTPQMFRIGALRQALQAAGEQVTDESSAMESMGWQPRLVPSSARNFKVTYPEDFALAEALLLSDTQRKASS